MSAYQTRAPGGKEFELAELGSAGGSDGGALEDVKQLRHLRVAMCCYVTRNATNKILMCLILMSNPIWFTLLGLAIFDSMPISVLLGVYIYAVCCCWMLAPNVTRGKMYDLLLENPTFAREMNRSTGCALWSFPFIIGFVLYPVISFAVIYRYLIADGYREGGPIFGEHSVLILVLISLWQTFSAFWMVHCSVLIPGYRKFIADMMELKIKEYIDAIATELRQDLNSNVADVLQRITVLQRPAEEWARQVAEQSLN